MTIKTHCKFDELIDPAKLKNHPKNRNKHGQDQIERLAKLYEHHGIRHPIIVSQLSGFIVAGHGRKLSAIRAGLKEFPVVYQNFENESQEYQFIQADNAIALWAELDMSGIHEDLMDLEPFDLELLGIHDFKLEPDPELAEDEKGNMADEFGAPPFSIIDTRQGYWQDRKRKWLNMGIESELGRGGGQYRDGSVLQKPKTIGAIPPNQKSLAGMYGKRKNRN